MRPAFPIVLLCPVCGEGIIALGSDSGNSFGIQFWTDGKTVEPNMRYNPRLVMCPHCQNPIWMDEAEYFPRKAKKGQDDPAKVRRQNLKINRRAQYFRLLSENDYLQVLTKPQPPKKEFYIRQRIWWDSNDPYREENCDDPVVITPVQQQNLRALALILDETKPLDLLLKAEISRELGEFRKALLLCEQVFKILDASPGPDDSDHRHYLGIQTSLAFRSSCQVKRYF
jgi:Zn-finger nucleic acid-binding protein